MTYKADLEERYRQVRRRLGIGVRAPVVPNPLSIASLPHGGIAGSTGLIPPLLSCEGSVEVALPPPAPEPIPEPAPVPEPVAAPVVNEAKDRAKHAGETLRERIADDTAFMPRLRPLRNFDYKSTLSCWQRMVVAVADRYEIEADDILGLRRARNIVQARQECMYRMRTELRMTFPNIAEKLNRDHSTVIHGVNTILGRLLDEAQNREHSMRALPAAMSAVVEMRHPELVAA